MIISFRHKFIFLKTRKTGSSSIQMALSGACGDEDIVVGDERSPSNAQIGQNIERSFTRNAHLNLRQIRPALAAGQWSLFYKIAFVRNPYDLVISRYHWEKKGFDCSVDDFREWLQTYLDAELVKPARNAQGNIVERVWQTGGRFVFDLQHPFVFEGEKQAIDFIGRYESLGADYGRLCQTLGLPESELPHLKASFRKERSYRKFYDAESKTQVAKAFARDLGHFQYEF